MEDKIRFSINFAPPFTEGSGRQSLGHVRRVVLAGSAFLGGLGFSGAGVFDSKSYMEWFPI